MSSLNKTNVFACRTNIHEREQRRQPGTEWWVSCKTRWNRVQKFLGFISKRLTKTFLCTPSVKLCDNDTPFSSRIFCITIPGAVWKVIGLLYYINTELSKSLTWADISKVNCLLPFCISDFLSLCYKEELVARKLLFLTSHTTFLLSGLQGKQGIMFYIKLLEGGYDKRLNPC